MCGRQTSVPAWGTVRVPCAGAQVGPRVLRRSAAPRISARRTCAADWPAGVLLPDDPRAAGRKVIVRKTTQGTRRDGWRERVIGQRGGVFMGRTSAPCMHGCADCTWATLSDPDCHRTFPLRRGEHCCRRLCEHCGLQVCSPR